MIEEGNVRAITIDDKARKKLISFPLTLGIERAVFAPILAGIGVMPAFVKVNR